MRFLCAILLAGGAVLHTVQAETVDYIAAIVNDTVITYRQVEQYSAWSIEGLQFNPHVKAGQREERATGIMREGLEHLLENQLILWDYKTGTMKVPQNIINDEVDRRIRKQFGDRVAASKKLKEMGMSYETLRQKFEDGVILDVMNQRHVTSGILISPQKIEQYYAANQARFNLDEEIRLRMIVLSRPDSASADPAQAMAQEILNKINEGASFSEMAAIYSEGTQRAFGGDWGWKESSKMSKGLADVAASLKPGERSLVLGKTEQRNSSEPYWMYQYDKSGKLVSARKYQTRKGDDKEELVQEEKFGSADAGKASVPPDEYYIMMLEERRPARVRTLVEVRPEIEKELKLKEQDRLRTGWIDRLRKKSFIRYF